MENQILVPIELIDANPYQPRQIEDPAAVAEIAESIKRNGLMQTPVSRQVDGRYQLAFGHTRLAAFKLLQEECMPLIVRELDDLQMFELGVAENIKRRDLNTIEKAEAMRRYMDEFGKTSVEASEFFNTTPEDVRGTVRLNNLPPEAKEKLAKGEITITMARTLLSMQKVAPAEVIVKTLHQIEKEGSEKDRFGFQATPEEVVETVMEDLPEVKEMWTGYNSAKPRGGSADAWLLDMKNFPNRFLPEPTPVDVVIALGIQDDERMCEKVQDVGQQVEDGEPLLQALRDAFTNEDPELLKKIEHLFNPPACTACPFYTIVNGSHYCGMETCFNRKTYAWEKEKLRAASKDLKIEIYNPETDGEYRVLEETWSDNGKRHLELFSKRSKDLRLALAKDIDRKKPQSGYKGVPSGSVVMLVGKSLKTFLDTGQKERAEKRSKEHAAAQLSNLREEKREKLDWEVAEHVKSLFDGMNLAALRALWETPGRYSNEWETNIYTVRSSRKPTEKAKDSEWEDFYRLMFAFNMVRKIQGSWWRQTAISEYAKDVAEKIKSWGVKLPKSITKLASQMDEEIWAVTAVTEE